MYRNKEILEFIKDHPEYDNFYYDDDKQVFLIKNKNQRNILLNKLIEFNLYQDSSDDEISNYNGFLTLKNFYNATTMENLSKFKSLLVREGLFGAFEIFNNNLDNNYIINISVHYTTDNSINIYFLKNFSDLPKLENKIIRLITKFKSNLIKSSNSSLKNRNNYNKSIKIMGPAKKDYPKILEAVNIYNKKYEELNLLKNFK